MGSSGLGQRAESSKDVISAQDYFSLILWGALEHKLFCKDGSPFRQMRGWGAFVHPCYCLLQGITCPATQLPIIQRQFSREGGSCKPLTANAHSIWGIDVWTE